MAGSELAIAYSRRSDAFIEARKLDEAIADRAKALELQPNDSEYKKRLSQAYYVRAVAARAKKKINEALSDYDAAIHTDPANANAYADRSEVFFERKEFDKGIADLKAALQLDNNPLYRMRLSKVHENRGLEHILKKDPHRAIAEYTHSIELDPTNAVLYVQRATAHSAKSDFDNALKDHAKAIALNPNLVDAYLRRAEILFVQKAFAPAVTNLDQVIKRDEKNVSALIMRALLHEEIGDPHKAAADYRAVLGIEAGHQLAKASLDRVERTVKAIVPPRQVPAGSGRSFADHPNHDLHGGDLRQLKEITHDACAAACLADPDCQAYAFDKWNRWCFLKSTLGTLRFDPKYDSGIREGTGTVTRSSAALTIERFRNKAFPVGATDSRRTTATVEDCESRCQTTTSCVAYTYTKLSRQCRLIADPGEYSSDPDAVSGVKRQLPPS